MLYAIARRGRLALVPLSVSMVIGCGGKPAPDFTVNPALANKPFPPVNAPGDKAKPKTSSFPAVGAKQAGP